MSRIRDNRVANAQLCLRVLSRLSKEKESFLKGSRFRVLKMIDANVTVHAKPVEAGEEERRVVRETAHKAAKSPMPLPRP